LLHFFRYTCHEIVLIFEDEEASAVIFIEPNDGCAFDEDSADEDDGDLIDNLTGGQLNAPAEALLSDGHRITGPQNESNECNNINLLYEEPNWKKDILLRERNPIFSEADYSSYRDFSPMQLFELFFDEEAYNLIVQQTILYAHGKGEANFLLTVKKIKVVFGILLVSGIVPVSCRQMFWKHFYYNKKRSSIQCHASKSL